EILIEVSYSVVLIRHYLTFSAILMQPYPKSFAVLGKVVLNFHVYDRTDTGKGVAHESNQSPIAQAYEFLEMPTGRISSKSVIRLASHHLKNSVTACA